MNEVALLIPCYEPNDKVLGFLKQFKEDDFDYFLLVNDGSGEKYDSIFSSIDQETVFNLLYYGKNKGKGGALKTGIEYILNENPDIDCIVTCDCDGQHTYEDILNVKNRAIKEPNSLVMGVRQFSKENVPARSKFGNNFSKFYFKLVTKTNCRDTQTGLRAIPSCLFDLALNTPGNRFDYEMNFLLEAVKEVPLAQVDISTVYEPKGEHKSHFKTLKDSFLIYKAPILYVLISIISFFLDIGIFALLSTFVFTNNSEQQVFLSNLVCRIISGSFNFLMLNFIVFRTKGNIVSKTLKYWLLWLINYGLSSSLTYLFEFLPMALSFIKIIIDTIIAILNYNINLTFVFARRKSKKKAKLKKGEVMNK